MATVPPFDNITIKLSGQPHRSNVCLYKNTIFLKRENPLILLNLNYIFILNFRFFILVAEVEIAQYFKITDFG